MAVIVNFKDLYRNSRQNHSKNGVIAYIIFFFSTLLMCGFIALSLLLPSLMIVVVPFIVFPLLFASQASIRLMRNTETLTLKGFFGCFFGYFSEHFSSTFRVLRSSLFSLIFFGCLLLTSMIVSCSCFYAFNYYGFKQLIDELVKIPYFNIEAMNSLIEDYQQCIEVLFVYLYYPSFAAFTLVLIYLSDRNSVSLFLRLDKPLYFGKYLSTLSDVVKKNNRKEFNKAYWGLNWPFYVLLLGGFALGTYLGYIYYFNVVSLLTFGIITAIGVAYILYGPTLLANKEAIYQLFKDQYDIEDAVLKLQFANSFEEMFKNLNTEQDKKDDE